MQVKGRTFKITFDFILQKFGKSKLDSFFKDYPALAEINNYTDIDWYSLKTFSDLSETVDKYFGFGDGSLMEELGVFSSQKAFETSHKLFMGLAPDSMISNAQTLVSSYYSEVTVITNYLKEKKVEMTFTGFSDSVYVEKRILGWLKETMKLIGAKNLHISNSKFTYIIEWTN